MERLLLCKWIIASLVLIKGIVSGVVIDVHENSAATIQCPLNIQYPTWTGPDGLANPLNDGQTITEPGIEWVNSKDLKIVKAMLKHDGNYTCSDGNGSSETMELDVQYFSAWADLTPATSENSTTVLTCWCQSNPRCKIVPHTITHVDLTGGIQDRNKTSTITFHPCVPNPDMENRTRCSMVANLQVTKKENGREMSCAFEYKNSTALTLYPKVKVTFPPTKVNITTVQEKHKLALNCSTDSSNPVSSLTWRRGPSPGVSENAIIHSSYKSYSMAAEYNGENITQALDIEKESIQDGEKVFCCAQHKNKQLCDSIAIDKYQIYFSAWADLTPATSENSTTVLTCWCQSNPRCKIVPHTITHVDLTGGIQDRNKTSTITFHPCVPNPDMENRTRCSMVANLQVTKKENGREMSCAFEYKNSTALTLYPKVKVTFPPTKVNITTVQEKHKLALNCSTDSSNPVSSLTWRRGPSPGVSENAIIHSSYKSYSMAAEYNGENITQALDIEKESIQDGEKVFCCAQHKNKQLCDSIAIDKYQISGASVVTAWMTTLFVGAAFFTI